MWSTRIIVAAVAALVAVAAVDALRSRDHPPPASRQADSSSPTVPAPTASAAVGECGSRDLSIQIGLRRPSASSDWAEWVVPGTRQRMAAVVLRNESEEPCYVDGAADMTILDHTGGIVRQLHLPRWFSSRIYPPGFRKTLPLSGVFSCDTPGGPFVAVANVDLWLSEREPTILENRQGGLTRHDFGCRWVVHHPAQS
jgi:hypothetical protein